MVNIIEFVVNVTAEKCALFIVDELFVKIYGAAGRKAHAAIAGARRW